MFDAEGDLSVSRDTLLLPAKDGQKKEVIKYIQQNSNPSAKYAVFGNQSFSRINTLAQDNKLIALCAVADGMTEEDNRVLLHN